MTRSNELPRVSVVIPAYLERDTLVKAIRSVAAQNIPPHFAELIVVDSSPDDSNRPAVEAEIAASKNIDIHFHHKTAEGPAASRNLGIKHARGEFVAFMDSDCVATPDWLTRGIESFDDPTIGIVQGRTIPDPSQRPGIFTWYVHVEQETFIYECANIFYRRQALQAVDGFSNAYTSTGTYVMGGEDLDLAWRVKRAGWKSTFALEALVYHEVQPIRVRDWIWIRRQALFPRLAKSFPEIRQFFFARVFLDRHQALITLALVGTFFAYFSPWSLLAWLPYVIGRMREPTRSLRGPLRIVRVAAYLLRDLSSFLILLRSSLRHGSIVL